MEKRIEKIEKVKYMKVKDGFQEVVSYVASDGRTFTGRNAKKDCEHLEEIIENEKIFKNIPCKVLNGDFSSIPDVWYLPRNEKELSIIKNKIGYFSEYYYVYVNNERKNKNKNQMVVNVWYGAYEIDNGDYKGDLYICSYDFVKENLNSIVKSISDFILYMEK